MQHRPGDAARRFHLNLFAEIGGVAKTAILVLEAAVRCPACVSGAVYQNRA